MVRINEKYITRQRQKELTARNSKNYDGIKINLSKKESVVTDMWRAGFNFTTMSRILPKYSKLKFSKSFIQKTINRLKKNKIERLDKDRRHKITSPQREGYPSGYRKLSAKDKRSYSNKLFDLEGSRLYGYFVRAGLSEAYTTERFGPKFRQYDDMYVS